MQNRSPLPACARFVGDFGRRVALSLATSAVAATVLALLSQQPSAPPTAQTETAWTAPSAAEGKILERHHHAASVEAPTGGLSVAGLVTPAAFAMPMSAAWPDAAFGASSPVAGVIAPPAPTPRPATAVALPAARKPLAPPERQRLAQSAPPAEAARLVEPLALIEPARLRTAQTAAPSTLGRLGGAVADAIGTVGAVGIWTLSQASGLLPRL